MRIESVGVAGLLAAGFAVSLWLAASPAVRAQSEGRPMGVAAAAAPGRGVREIRDPHTGAQWLVVPNRLNPAGPGSEFRVRLTIAGKVVRAVAMAPGRAALLGGER
jgi:hypothetical protein